MRLALRHPVVLGLSARAAAHSAAVQQLHTSPHAALTTAAQPDRTQQPDAPPPPLPAGRAAAAATALAIARQEPLLQRTMQTAISALHRLVALLGSLRHLGANEACEWAAAPATLRMFACFARPVARPPPLPMSLQTCTTTWRVPWASIPSHSSTCM